MSNTIDAIEKLRESKENEVKRVYEVQDLDTVYERQATLNSMAGSIYTDVANVMLPVLKKDGFSALVWPNISGNLDQLRFIGVPTASEIREKYGKAVAGAVGSEKKDYEIISQNIHGRPKEKETVYIKEKSLPGFLVRLAAQGIAIPLVLKTVGHSWPVLAKVIFGAVAGVIIAVEIIKYFNIPKRGFKGNVKTHSPSPRTAGKPSEPHMDWNALYFKAIERVKEDNLKELNRWFYNLKKLTEKELQNAVARGEGK